MNNGLNRFKFLFAEFFKFIYVPYINVSERLSVWQKYCDVILFFTLIDFLISIFLWFLTEIIEKMGLFNPLNVKIATDFSIIEIFIIGLVIAPILEEFIFRYPLKHFIYKKRFKWILYVCCTAFGLIHLSNYQIDSSHILFAPLIVIIQIYGAFMFSFIRLRYGFWYGVLLHITHNIWSLIWKYTIGFDL